VNISGSECKWVFRQISPRLYFSLASKEQFSSCIHVIARPPDADTATLRGAAQCGLSRRPLVASVIAPRAYIMKVRVMVRPGWDIVSLSYIESLGQVAGRARGLVETSSVYKN